MLTGFDSKWVNTLYMDKILEYENIIQAFSRTNRLFGPDKPFGVIRYYRKPHTMEQNVARAVKLYSGDKPIGLFVEKLSHNLEKMNSIFNDMSEVFKNANIPDFTRLPEEKAVKAKFASLFRDFNTYLEAAKVQGFKWSQELYEFADTENDEKTEITVDFDEKSYLILAQRYKELFEGGGEGGRNEDVPYDLVGYLIEIDTGRIDSDYMNSRFEKYLKLIKQEGIPGELIEQLKGAILDAVDEGLIERDPTRKAIIKGKTPAVKKIKYLNQFELHNLLASLDLKDKVNWDYFILLVAKTGMRFSEALALTPNDFDFAHQTLSINKTWDYKGKSGFQPTKNRSSVRKIQIDWQTVIQFSELIKHLPEDKPIFVDGAVYNSTVNNILARHCKECNIPVISIHGLRHTHASLLLFTGVSIASVARRLGHSSMTTTQKTYLHIIQELENKDIDLVMRSLSSLS